MAASVFLDKSAAPSQADVAEVLGTTAALWTGLKRRAAALFAPLTEEWVHAGKSRGWSLRLKRKTRAVLYMTPQEGFFRAAFALGEKAVAAARGAGLPDEVLVLIDGAPRYAEGRGVWLEVRNDRDVESVLRIAAVKMAN